MTTTFILKVDTESTAFECYSGVHAHSHLAWCSVRAKEVARILREVATRLENGETFSHSQTLLDLNGNDVGRAAFKQATR